MHINTAYCEYSLSDRFGFAPWKIPLQPCVDTSAWTVLRCEYADARTVADLINPVSQIDHRKSPFELSQRRNSEVFGDPGVELNVERLVFGVGEPCTQAASVNVGQREQKPIQVVCDSGGLAESLVMVEKDVMRLAKRQFIRGKQELLGITIDSLGDGISEIGVEGEVLAVQRSGKFHPVLAPLGIVERREYQGWPELALINKVSGLFVI